MFIVLMGILSYAHPVKSEDTIIYPQDLPPTQEEIIEPFPLEYSFKRMIFSLVALIALLLISFWFLKRMMQGKLRPTGESKKMRIIEKKPLSAKSMLYLVEVEQEKVLLVESQIQVRPILRKSSKFPDWKAAENNTPSKIP